MVIKAELEVLSKVEALECLLKRVPLNHSQREYLEIQLYRASAGIRGESKMIKKLKEFYIDEEYQAIWDMNMKMGDWSVQMDGLLLTNRCAIILESKNISDEIHYDKINEEFYKKSMTSAESVVLENPVVQLNKHIRFLQRWFKLHKINLPVTGLIVFTANNCVFHSKPPGAFICKTYQMNEYLYRILEQYPLEASSHKLKKIKKMISTNQTPYKKSPLCEFYHIDVKDIKTGVYCHNCADFHMKRIKKSWICASCNWKNPIADQLAMQEYFSLISTQLTNKKLREFSGISSSGAAWRILSKYNLDRRGERKTRIYQLKNR